MLDEVTLVRKRKGINSKKYDGWLKRFNKKNGDFGPRNYDNFHWPDVVKKMHKDLHELINGETAKYKISVRIGQEELDAEKRLAFWKEIVTILPKLPSHYNINDAILRYPQYKMRIIVRGVEKFRYIATSKFISTYAEKVAKVNDMVKMDINKVLEKLGQHWAKLKNIDKSYFVTVTASPVAFTMLGHYGPDQGSCFRHAKENNHHKFILGESKDTFIFLIQEKNEDGKIITLSRQWGFYNGFFNICNLYMSKINDVVVQKINNKIFEFLSKQELKMHPNLIKVDGGKFYHNKQKHDWTFAPKSHNKTLTEQVI